jgi:hypothetical protein
MKADDRVGALLEVVIADVQGSDRGQALVVGREDDASPKAADRRARRRERETPEPCAEAAGRKVDPGEPGRRSEALDERICRDGSGRGGEPGIAER